MVSFTRFEKNLTSFFILFIIKSINVRSKFMENKLNTEVDVLLSICKDEDHEKISKIGYALSSLSRIKILQNIIIKKN